MTDSMKLNGDLSPLPTARPSLAARAKDRVVSIVCSLSGCEHGEPTTDAVTTDVDRAGSPDVVLTAAVPTAAGSAAVATVVSPNAAPAAGRTETGSQTGVMSAPDGATPPPPPEGKGVVAVDLSKTYADGTVALRGVSFSASPGEIVAMVGPNGAGKSTALNIVSGLIVPTGGAATVEGIPTTEPRRLARELGVALQTAGLDPSMTASEHLDMQAALYEMDDAMKKSQSELLLEMFDLHHYSGRPVAGFSGGLQRRLVVALSLLHDPKVIIMDEPTAGLDPQSKRTVWALLEILRDKGRTIIFSTQMLEEADHLADRVYVMDRGEILAHGRPSDLRRRFGHYGLKIRTVSPATDIVALLEPLVADPARLTVVNDDTVRIDGIPSTTDIAETALVTLRAAEVQVAEFSLAPPSLEDAFVELTGSVVREEPEVAPSGLLSSICRCG